MPPSASTPLATILIPTFDHADLIAFPLRSILRQSDQDFEILVVGDGVPERTREVLAPFLDDPRIRFFDNPKGTGNGELHRHAALQDARGEIVCYCGDDDLWLPDHLATLREAVRDADFAHTMHVFVSRDMKVDALPCDLADRRIRRAMLAERTNFFGPSVAGHTLSFYRTLPFGWRPGPKDLWSDLHMWRQIVAMPHLRARSVMRATTIKFAASTRIGWSMQRRLDELAFWDARSQEPGFHDWYWEQATRALSRRLLDVTFERRDFLWRLARHVKWRLGGET